MVSRPSLWIQRSPDLQLAWGLLWGVYEARLRHPSWNILSQETVFCHQLSPALPPSHHALSLVTQKVHAPRLGTEAVLTERMLQFIPPSPHHASVKFSGSGGLGFSSSSFQHLHTMMYKMESFLVSLKTNKQTNKSHSIRDDENSQAHLPWLALRTLAGPSGPRETAST